MTAWSSILFIATDAVILGEPDLELRTLPDGKLQVELHGLDVYDPITGEIRSNTTDEIACWFIDSDYNEESFFVRHAYFTGADEPYKKLQRALKAEIDEDAWATPLQHREPPVRCAVDRQDRGEGDQPLRGRGAEGVPDRSPHWAGHDSGGDIFNLGRGGSVDCP